MVAYNGQTAKLSSIYVVDKTSDQQLMSGLGFQKWFFPLVKEKRRILLKKINMEYKCNGCFFLTKVNKYIESFCSENIGIKRVKALALETNIAYYDYALSFLFYEMLG